MKRRRAMRIGELAIAQEKAKQEKKAARKRDYVNKKEAETHIMNAVVAGKYMDAQQLKEFIVLLYIRHHRSTTDYWMRIRLAFLRPSLAAILKSYVDDGSIISFKRKRFYKTRFYVITNIGMRKVEQKLKEIRDYQI